MKPLINYFSQSIAELRQVVWPTRQMVIQYTAVILVSVAVAMLLVASLDYGLGLIVDRFIIK